MIRHVADDLYQLGECVTGENGHEAVNIYVFKNGGAPIVIDCGSHLHRETLLAELLAVLDGAAPEYMFLTHSELPHSGNIEQVAAHWPDIHVLVSNIMLPYIEVAPALPRDQITAVNPGASLELSGRKLLFLDALLKDQPGSQWIFDARTGALFTGDGFGYYHEAPTCGRFSDELARGVAVEQFRVFHRNAFRFLRWVIAERMNADLRAMFAALDVQIIAPIHGSAIRGEVATHVDRLAAALELAVADLRNYGNENLR